MVRTMHTALRTLTILRTLAERPSTVRELAKRHRVDDKTIRRALITIEQAGFALDWSDEPRGRKRWRLKAMRAKR